MNSPIYTGNKILGDKRQQLLKKGLTLAAAAGAGALTVTCGVTQAMADAGMNRRMPVWANLSTSPEASRTRTSPCGSRRPPRP